MKFLKTLLFFVFVFAALNVHAQSSDDLKKQRDKINNELDQLNRELQETQTNKKSTLKQLNNLKAQISLREQKIGIINNEVRNLDNQISESTNTVHTLQSELDQLKKEYAAMVLFAYRNQSAYNKLMFIFASKDFNQAYKRLKYLQQFATYRERQAASIQGKQNDLHVKIVELDKTKEQKHTLLVDQEKEKKTLGKQKNDQLEEVNNLSKQERQLLAQYQAKQRQRDKINRDIVRKIIEEERRKQEEADRLAAAKAKASGSKDVPVVTKAPVHKTNSEILNSTPEAAKLSSDFLGNKGRLPWPVTEGRITLGFGPYRIEGINDESVGVEIKTNPDQPIRAVFEGIVKRVENVLGTWTVIISHGEYLTMYGNLQSHNVKVGQKVSTKQNIGTVATDRATGETEVSFQIWKAVEAVDPQKWLADK